MHSKSQGEVAGRFSISLTKQRSCSYRVELLIYYFEGKKQATMTQLIQELINLTPVNVRWVNNSPLIEWCNFENLVFTDPFFIHTYFRLQEQQPNLQIGRAHV